MENRKHDQQLFKVSKRMPFERIPVKKDANDVYNASNLNLFNSKAKEKAANQQISLSLKDE